MRQLAEMKPMDPKSLYAQPLITATLRGFTALILNGDHKVVAVFRQWALGMAWTDPGTGRHAGMRSCHPETPCATPLPDLSRMADQERSGRRAPRATGRMSAADQKAVREDPLRSVAENGSCHLSGTPEVPNGPSVISSRNHLGTAKTIME